jgi:hypothetical protein
MQVSKRLLTVGLAVGLASGAAWVAFAQSPTPEVLGNNEGIFVDSKNFNISKGKSKTDPAAQIAKLNAKEVGPGAIIFRSGDKLYLADGTPPGASARQGMKDFQDTFTMMKDFQDTFTMMK